MKHPITRRQALGSLGAAAAALAAPAALAQAWPAKPVTLVVPFPAGGGTDTFARPLSAQLTKQMGKQVLIDNRGGAGGTLGATVAAKAAGDGYTFFMGGLHHAIAPSMYPKLDYDLERDFIPVGLISSVPQVIVVNPQRVPVSDLKGLLDYLRKNPGKLNYASAGNGSAHHLAGELFKLQTRTDLSHIPYKGAGPALQDLVGGQVDLMFDGLGSSASHIKGGRIKALAVASPQRAPGFDAVPTTAEGGLASYQMSTWYALWAVKGTPKEVVSAMQAELKKALNSEELRTQWHNLGTTAPDLYGADFGAFVSNEIRRWAEVVKSSGAKLD